MEGKEGKTKFFYFYIHSSVLCLASIGPYIFLYPVQQLQEEQSLARDNENLESVQHKRSFKKLEWWVQILLACDTLILCHQVNLIEFNTTFKRFVLALPMESTHDEDYVLQYTMSYPLWLCLLFKLVPWLSQNKWSLWKLSTGILLSTVAICDLPKLNFKLRIPSYWDNSVARVEKGLKLQNVPAYNMLEKIQNQ